MVDLRPHDTSANKFNAVSAINFSFSPLSAYCCSCTSTVSQTVHHELSYVTTCHSDYCITSLHLLLLSFAPYSSYRGDKLSVMHLYHLTHRANHWLAFLTLSTYLTDTFPSLSLILSASFGSYCFALDILGRYDVLRLATFDWWHRCLAIHLAC